MGGVSAFTAWQAYGAKQSLQQSSDDIDAVVAALRLGDAPEAQRVAVRAHEAAFAAHRKTSGPVWWLGSKVPYVGDDVTAVREVAAVASDLTGAALDGVVDAALSLTPEELGLTDGKVRLDPIRRAAPALGRAADGAGLAADRIEAVKRGGLLRPTSQLIDDVTTKVDRARDLTRRAAVAADLAPEMFGGEGKRTYLAVFQNNSEIRATGGIPGSYAIITARDGKLTMGRQGSQTDFGFYDKPVVPVTGPERAIFSERIAEFPQSTNLTPQFPRSAQFLHRMWQLAQDQDVDGIISVDPVAMGYVLRGTGPVTVPGRFDGRPLTTLDAASVLLRDLYLTVRDTDLQDDIFNDSARAIFDAATSGKVDPAALLDAIVQSASERRMLLWSADKAEQKAIDGLTVSGDLAATPTRHPEVGVYVNDSLSDKLSYYLDYHADVTPVSCGSEGNQVLDVKVTLTSRVKRGVTYPDSVVGFVPTGVPNGTMRDTVHVYSPVQGRLESVLDGAQKVPVDVKPHLGREVGSLTVTLAPGETRTLTFRVLSGRDQTLDAHLVTAPAALGSGLGTIGRSNC